MPAERYFTDSPLMPQSTITLEGLEHHHLFNVMRSKPEERVELINGKGVLAEGVIVATSKKKTEIEIIESRTASLPTTSYTLIQAVPRMNRLDTIIEKCTELGVEEILLWPSDRSERKRLNETQLNRLRQVAVAATKQCGRLFLPKIEWIQELPSRDLLLYGDVAPEAPSFLEVWKKPKTASFVVGPESGLSQGEEKRLKQLGAIGVKLHANILRTDTAAIVACALMTQNI